MKMLLALAAAAVALGTAAHAETLTLERLFRDPDLAGPRPRALQLSPDGRYATYLKGRPENDRQTDLWAFDAQTKTHRKLVDSTVFTVAGVLSEAERMRRERERIVDTCSVEYAFSSTGDKLLAPLQGDLFLATLDGKVTRLTDTPETELGAKLSPDTGKVAFVRGPDLYVRDIAAKQETRLTSDGSDTILNGQAEFVAQEEMDRDTGFWWSPTSTAIAYTRVDESAVPIVERLAIGAEGGRSYTQRYPFAGAANAKVQLFVAQLGGAAKVEIDLGRNADIYLARVAWFPDGKRLLVQTQPRDQSRIDVWEADATTGKTRLLWQETSKTWTNLHHDLAFLKDGTLLWSSERSGFRHLYRIDPRAPGKARALTSGEWVVSSLKGVDTARGLAFFTGFKDTILEQHLYSVPVTGGAVTRLTQPGAWHEVSLSSNGSTFISTASAPGMPPRVQLAESRTGKAIGWIEENVLLAGHPFMPFADDQPQVRFGTLTAADGKTPLHYQLILPKDFDATKRYPAIVEVYAGPGVHRVRRTWLSPRDQVIANRGFVIFKVDNRGADNRGKAFEDVLFKKLGGPEVDDQLAALTWLKAQPFVAPERVGVWGWSYGGYMVLRLMTQAPEAYAAGFSGAPVSEWRLYDTHYTERFMGDPNTPAGIKAYDAASVLPDAAKFKRPLFLVHGMADDNVVFEHSTRMMALMQKANVPFETQVYPGQTHRFGDRKMELHMWTTALRFFERTLKP
jgi:dipeptidyl-peptidase 4